MGNFVVKTDAYISKRMLCWSKGLPAKKRLPAIYVVEIASKCRRCRFGGCCFLYDFAQKCIITEKSAPASPKRDYLPFMSSKLRLNVDVVVLGVAAFYMILLKSV